MAASVTATPSSGTATKTAFRIDALGIEDTNFSTYDSTPTPPAFAETAYTYTIIGHEGGNVKLRSQVFTPDSSTGKHSWQGVIVPDAGSWTFAVVRNDGATVCSVGVTVS